MNSKIHKMKRCFDRLDAILVKFVCVCDQSDQKKGGGLLVVMGTSAVDRGHDCCRLGAGSGGFFTFSKPGAATGSREDADAYRVVAVEFRVPLNCTGRRKRC